MSIKSYFEKLKQSTAEGIQHHLCYTIFQTVSWGGWVGTYPWDQTQEAPKNHSCGRALTIRPGRDKRVFTGPEGGQTGGCDRFNDRRRKLPHCSLGKSCSLCHWLPWSCRIIIDKAIQFVD